MNDAQYLNEMVGKNVNFFYNNAWRYTRVEKVVGNLLVAFEEKKEEGFCPKVTITGHFKSYKIDKIEWPENDM